MQNRLAFRKKHLLFRRNYIIINQSPDDYSTIPGKPEQFLWRLYYGSNYELLQTILHRDF